MAKFYLLGNKTPSQMFGCVIKTEKNTIVIDGGCLGDERQLVDLLSMISNNHVDAWFFTHPHSDHIGCFYGVRTNFKQVKIDKVYCCFPDLDLLSKYGSRNTFEVALWKEIETWPDNFKVCKFSRGETFIFDDVKLSVLRVFNPKIIIDFVNNSSSVFRIENNKNSFLILGDLSVEGGEELIKTCSIELLRAEYMQMAHHGQNGVTKEFYEYIKPKKCIWATPKWLWDNDVGGGFDTGPYKTVQTRKLMDDLGVKEHFIEKDGLQIIDF